VGIPVLSLSQKNLALATGNGALSQPLIIPTNRKPTKHPGKNRIFIFNFSRHGEEQIIFSNLMLIIAEMSGRLLMSTRI